MRPGSLEAMGLGAEAVRALNPRLIYCYLHAFGAKGPMALQPGYEPIVQAFAGMFSVNGTAEGRRPGSGCRCSTSAPGSGRRSAAWRRCRGATRPGRAASVDTSLFETGLGWMAQHSPAITSAAGSRRATAAATRS